LYKEAIEPVISHFASDRYVPEFTQAKEFYFQRTGKVFEDDPSFEVRMNSFLEWYIFDRVLVNAGVPPIRLYLLIYRDEMEPERRALLESLQHTNHSLFETLSVSSARLKVRDIYTDEVHDLPQQGIYAAVQKGDLLDSRLLNVKGEKSLSDAMWLHPREVGRWILDETEKVRAKGREEFKSFLFDLAYKKIKRDQYKHLNANDIYKGKAA
jgi:hypothetical protein